MNAQITKAREAELDRERAKLRNIWRISDDLRMPHSPAKKVWRLVGLEMKFYMMAAEFNRGRSVALHARRWIETGNPHHIDAAVYLCAQSGIAPPPALAVEVAKLAELRLGGPVRRGTADNIWRAGVLDKALVLMANLRVTGASLEVAASKAAMQIASAAPARLRLKASTLERRYSERWLEGVRGQTLEDDLREARKLHAPEINAQWETILAALPNADPELKGERR